MDDLQLSRIAVAERESPADRESIPTRRNRTLSAEGKQSAIVADGSRLDSWSPMAWLDLIDVVPSTPATKTSVRLAVKSLSAIIGAFEGTAEAERALLISIGSDVRDLKYAPLWSGYEFIKESRTVEDRNEQAALVEKARDRFVDGLGNFAREPGVRAVCEANIAMCYLIRSKLPDSRRWIVRSLESVSSAMRHIELLANAFSVEALSRNHGITVLASLVGLGDRAEAGIKNREVRSGAAKIESMSEFRYAIETLGGRLGCEGWAFAHSGHSVGRWSGRIIPSPLKSYADTLQVSYVSREEIHHQPRLREQQPQWFLDLIDAADRDGIPLSW